MRCRLLVCLVDEAAMVVGVLSVLGDVVRLDWLSRIDRKPSVICLKIHCKALN